MARNHPASCASQAAMCDCGEGLPATAPAEPPLLAGTGCGGAASSEGGAGGTGGAGGASTTPKNCWGFTPWVSLPAVQGVWLLSAPHARCTHSARRTWCEDLPIQRGVVHL